MEQESAYKKIAVIGTGAAGGIVSILLLKNPYNKVTAFDVKEPFTSLLPTGGGRCNITNAQEDFREFAKNYPRGEKFLLSVFSRFDNFKTIKLLKELGVETYVQDDGRVFPVSNSSAKTIQILKRHLNTSDFRFIKQKVTALKKNDGCFVVKTNNGEYEFDNVILASGGKGNGFELAESLGHNIIDCKPSLCALDIMEEDFYCLAGLGFKNVQITAFYNGKKMQTVSGDILFAHKSITGPAVFKISALNAYTGYSKENPLVLNIKLVDISAEKIENYIKNNSKKSIKNVFSVFVPGSFADVILKLNNIDGARQIAQIKKSEKQILINSILNLKLHAVSAIKDSEIVTAGGVDLKEINSKTMESKIVEGLYCIGEVLDIDGFTGGFNLQNCWSGAYICSLNF